MRLSRRVGTPPATYVETHARKGTRRRDLQSVATEACALSRAGDDQVGRCRGDFACSFDFPFSDETPPEQKACGRKENSGDGRRNQKKRSRAAFLKRAARSLAEPNAHRQCTEVRDTYAPHTLTGFCMHGTCIHVPIQGSLRSDPVVLPRSRWRIFTWPGKPGQANQARPRGP